MAQRTVEVVLGKLATDEDARGRFRREPRTTVAELIGPEDSLTPVEEDALSSLDPDVLDRFADTLDPRIQKIRIPPAEGGRS